MGEGRDPFDEVYAALADATRRRILDVLATRGEATATTVAEHVPVSRQAVVKHLTVLDRAGLVRARRRGREVRYAVQPARVAASARWLERVAADWETRLAAIRRIAETADSS